ncbi:MAG: hypothetical protein P1U41_00415 [Vicingaceae bacterium]|nr:hypothetical protein [Vicingaceae bacterium]
MKKKVLFVASMFLATAMIAQDGLTSKKGEAYLPEAGDWALGFDGTPFLNYAGNMFNGTTGNSVNATWVGNQPAMTVYGKMFKDETTAYRAKIRIGFGSTTDKNFFDTSAVNPATVVELGDERKTSNFNITLGGGIEKRRGNTRIQGFYGGELLISFGSSSVEHTFGSTFSDDFTATWTDDFDAGTTTSSNGPRTTKVSNGSTMQIGLRGFAGVEWFIAPKVSVAAEYGWGLAMTSTGDGTVTTEEWGLATPTATDNSLITKETTQGGTSSFGIDTDNNGGVISIFFHF